MRLETHRWRAPDYMYALSSGFRHMSDQRSSSSLIRNQRGTKPCLACHHLQSCLYNSWRKPESAVGYAA